MTPIHPWTLYLEGRMSLFEYWGFRKAPSECSPAEMITLYGLSPCERVAMPTLQTYQTILSQYLEPLA
jgi:hypothetical protein